MRYFEIISEDFDSGYNNDALNIGDEVVVTGNVFGQGQKGEIVNFDSKQYFAVVKLADGNHSYNVSDLTRSDLVDDDEELDEDMWGRRARGWAILPATMVLYGKRVVDIMTAVSEWGSGTVYVCSKDEGGRSRILFVVSAGGGVGAKVGETYEAFHDQTGASKGMYTVLNVVQIADNEIVSKANDVGLNVKASVSVFK
jgi:hypothetical protein